MEYHPEHPSQPVPQQFHPVVFTMNSYLKEPAVATNIFFDDLNVEPVFPRYIIETELIPSAAG